MGWASEDEGAGLIYKLTFAVNNAVITKTQEWLEITSWASLLGISILIASPVSEGAGST